MSGERLNLTPFDFTVQDEGSIVILHPCNDAAGAWIDDYLYADDGFPQWFGGGIAIEPRFMAAIVDGIADAGLTIGVR
jgi:hypothetical protein